MIRPGAYRSWAMGLAALGAGLLAPPALAQTSPPMLPGEYSLQGIMEVASGFRFNADSTFDFYFIYGALDRFGRGRWVQQGDSVILDSPPKTEPDFILQGVQTTAEAQITIQVSDPNPQILRYVLCQIETVGGELLQGASDDAGRIVFDTREPLRRIALLHELWANEPCVTEIAQPEANHFEFTIAPTIIEIAFNHLLLRIAEGQLSGGHPLMQGDDFLYLKND